MTKKRQRGTLALSEQTVRNFSGELSDESRKAVVDRLAEETGEEPRIAEAIIEAHRKHYGPCSRCGGLLELIRLPALDQDWDDPGGLELDEDGVELRKGLVKCRCGDQGFVLNPKKGIKP